MRGYQHRQAHLPLLADQPPGLLPLHSPPQHAGRPETSSSNRASHQSTAPGASATVRVEGITRSGVVGARGRTTKGRSVLRAHLLRLVSPPSSDGHDHRRCRDFKPRPSRLGRHAVTA